MISIAHPDFRDELFYKAKELGLLGSERTLTESLHSVYPLHLEESWVIDGEKVVVRPAKPVDERRIQEHFYNLDKNDIVLRFFHQKTRFLKEEMSGVTQIDYKNDLTVIALVGEFGFGKVVGVGEYLLEPERNLAEVAFSISRAYQRKGLGKILLYKLFEGAEENGIPGFVAYTARDNKGMINLFKKLPFSVEKDETADGMLELICRFGEKDGK